MESAELSGKLDCKKEGEQSKVSATSRRTSAPSVNEGTLCEDTGEAVTAGAADPVKAGAIE